MLVEVLQGLSVCSINCRLCSIRTYIQFAWVCLESGKQYETFLNEYVATCNVHRRNPQRNLSKISDYAPGFYRDTQQQCTDNSLCVSQTECLDVVCIRIPADTDLFIPITGDHMTVAERQDLQGSKFEVNEWKSLFHFDHVLKSTVSLNWEELINVSISAKYMQFRIL